MSQIAKATINSACLLKPNIAFYGAEEDRGGLRIVRQFAEHCHSEHPQVPLLIDMKCGDTARTNERYARWAFDTIGADAVTVNPYLGLEPLAPFLERSGKGVFLLCRTSNPGSERHQRLTSNGVPLFLHIARDAALLRAQYGNVGVVVGAPFPEDLKLVRREVGDTPILSPGIGPQGGDLRQTILNGRDSNRRGIIPCLSRLLYPNLPAVTVKETEKVAMELNAQATRYFRAV